MGNTLKKDAFTLGERVEQPYSHAPFLNACKLIRLIEPIGRLSHQLNNFQSVLRGLLFTNKSVLSNILNCFLWKVQQ